MIFIKLISRKRLGSNLHVETFTSERIFHGLLSEVDQFLPFRELPAKLYRTDEPK